MGELTATINITDKDVLDYYNSSKDSYKYKEEMVRAKHILVKTIDNYNNELVNQEELKKKAEDILAKAKSGEDFASLAKQYSEDPGSKDTGGEYTFPRGQMVEEFENAAFSLRPGEISGLVKTRYGYHIIKLEEKYEKGQEMPFEQVKNDVKLDLQKKKILEGYNKTIEGLKEDSKIEINEAFLNAIQ